jgi:hypothetical protein
MTAELLALTEELRATQVKLDQVLYRLDAADRRAHRHRLWTFVLAVTVIGTLVLGGLFWRDQTQQRIAACERGNANRADIREAIVGTIERLATGASPERREALLTDAEAYLLETLPPRSC